MRVKFVAAVIVVMITAAACANRDNGIKAENEVDIISETEITEETEKLEAETSETEAFETEVSETNASEIIKSGQQPESRWEEMFYYTDITDEIKERITGKSYPSSGDNLQISYDDLVYLHVLHYDFNNDVQEGEIICNREIAEDLLDIFRELYDNKYQIEKIRLVDEYGADDEASMADNNTSCFNYRTIAGTDRISNHSYGKAIDINPLYNPYITTRNGAENISPENATQYADRTATFDHKIDTDDLCYKLFIQHGFTWGGAWKSSKDYQHFEKK
jgi:hypothetical protein